MFYTGRREKKIIHSHTKGFPRVQKLIAVSHEKLIFDPSRQLTKTSLNDYAAACHQLFMSLWLWDALQTPTGGYSKSYRGKDAWLLQQREQFVLDVGVAQVQIGINHLILTYKQGSYVSLCWFVFQHDKSKTNDNLMTN